MAAILVHFGSFGLSTKEPYTIMPCASLSLASSVHTSPSHRFKCRNFIFGIQMHICPPLVFFIWQPFWYFLAHLVYQPKNLIQLCFVCRWCCWHWHHLCTPPPGTWLDIKTLYLVHICTHVPHICTSNI